ncbi:hypothetical protein FHS77_003140 [Paenochrobactrum gallinarii]|uniref:Uncharacterized protein n=1 Tax=Paenochrobactrum gallinarii TaxID=643673 RepID=A0A841M1D2_9HYPH|nr:hypothetical protein [Paenochrobactrum gallinarii]
MSIGKLGISNPRIMGIKINHVVFISAKEVLGYHIE